MAMEDVWKFRIGVSVYDSTVESVSEDFTNYLFEYYRDNLKLNLIPFDNEIKIKIIDDCIEKTRERYKAMITIRE